MPSEVERVQLTYGRMEAADEGDYVAYSDYEAARAENAALVAELAAWKKWFDEMVIVPFNTNNPDDKVIPRLDELRRWFHWFHEWREQYPGSDDLRAEIERLTHKPQETR